MSVGTDPDQVLRLKGFDVEISGVDGAPGSGPDGSWRRVSGGAKSVEVVETTASQSGKRGYSPGRAYVSDLVLEGFMTKTPRRDLTQWLKDTIEGRNTRRNVRITPIDFAGKRGRTFVYEDCLIVEYKFPSCDASSADPAEEVVVIRPSRLEIC